MRHRNRYNDPLVQWSNIVYGMKRKFTLVFPVLKHSSVLEFSFCRIPCNALLSSSVLRFIVSEFIFSFLVDLSEFMAASNMLMSGFRNVLLINDALGEIDPDTPDTDAASKSNFSIFIRSQVTESRALRSAKVTARCISAIATLFTLSNVNIIKIMVMNTLSFVRKIFKLKQRGYLSIHCYL